MIQNKRTEEAKLRKKAISPVSIQTQFHDRFAAMSATRNSLLDCGLWVSLFLYVLGGSSKKSV